MKIVLPDISLSGVTDAALRTVVSVYNDARGILVGKLKRVASVEYVDVSAAASANEPFTVPHKLGAKPDLFTWQAESDVRCYASAADRSEWSATQIRIRCTGANAPLRIKIEVL